MKLLSIDLIHKHKFLNYYIAKYLNKDGNTKEYELISRDSNLTPDNFGSNASTDAVGIIAFKADDTNKILLQKEYRMACGEWVYNFAGGLIDAGETPVMTAARELYEETGLELVSIIDLLPKAYTAIGLSNESTMTILCTAIGDFKPSTSADEEIEANWYTKEEVRELIKTAPMSLRTQSFLYQWSNN